MGSLISSMWMENQKKKIDKLFEDSSICELKQTCYFECVATQSGKHSYNNHPKSLTIGGREGRGAGGSWVGGKPTTALLLQNPAWLQSVSLIKTVFDILILSSPRQQCCLHTHSLSYVDFII